MEEIQHLHIKIDPALNSELSETIAREGRSKTEITERALRDYIARSKAEAKQAAQAKKAAQAA